MDLAGIIPIPVGDTPIPVIQCTGTLIITIMAHGDGMIRITAGTLEDTGMATGTDTGMVTGTVIMDILMTTGLHIMGGGI